MKHENVKVDFQAAGWSVEQDRPARFGPLSRALSRRIEDFPKDLAAIATHAYAPGEKRAVFLLNYYQPKYERVVSEGLATIGAAGFEVHDDHRDTFVGITGDQGKSWLYVIRGREYLCSEGHLIAAGTPNSMNAEESWYTHGPKLRDVLVFETGNDALLIPSHPLSKFGLGAKAILKLIREPSGTNLGLQRDDIASFGHLYDAIEVHSLSMDAEQTKRVEELARDLQLPTVSNTDGDLRSSFVVHNVFDWLDFTNPERLRESIRAGLGGQGNSHREVRGKFETSTMDKINHILLNVAHSRRYF